MTGIWTYMNSVRGCSRLVVQVTSCKMLVILIARISLSLSWGGICWVGSDLIAKDSWFSWFITFHSVWCLCDVARIWRPIDFETQAGVHCTSKSGEGPHVRGQDLWTNACARNARSITCASNYIQDHTEKKWKETMKSNMIKYEWNTKQLLESARFY